MSAERFSTSAPPARPSAGHPAGGPAGPGRRLRRFRRRPWGQMQGGGSDREARPAAAARLRAHAGGQLLPEGAGRAVRSAMAAGLGEALHPSGGPFLRHARQPRPLHREGGGDRDPALAAQLELVPAEAVLHVHRRTGPVFRPRHQPDREPGAGAPRSNWPGWSGRWPPAPPAGRWSTAIIRSSPRVRTATRRRSSKRCSRC